MALSAAERLVITGGVAELTVRKIAAEIGYTPGSLYTLFDSLDELILELNGRTLDDLNAQLHVNINAGEPPRLQLRRIAQTYLQFALHHPHRWHLAFEHTLPHIEILPEKFQTKVDTIYTRVAEVLQSLVPANQLRLAAVTLWSTVHGMCTLILNEKLAQGGVAEPEPLLDFAMENYWLGLMSSNPKETS